MFNGASGSIPKQVLWKTGLEPLVAEGTSFVLLTPDLDEVKEGLRI